MSRAELLPRHLCLEPSHQDLACPVNLLPALDWHNALPVLQSFPGTGFKQGERGAQAMLLPSALARPACGSADAGRSEALPCI